MKADYYQYIAESHDGDDKKKAAEHVRLAFEQAQMVADKDIAVAHQIHLGLALNYYAFQYGVLQNPDEACNGTHRTRGRNCGV